MYLSVNQLLSWDINGKDVQILRVLSVDQSDDVIVIELYNSKALPFSHKYQDLKTALSIKDARILDIDPYAALLSPAPSFLEKHRSRRDLAWKIIAPIVETNQVFFPRERGRLIAAAEDRTGVSRPTIYEHLRRYWQGGQTKNALLPLFHHCGGQGKQRAVSEQKRGRPNNIKQVTGQSVGVNVDSEIQEYFHRGIKLFYQNRQERSLHDAFQLTLEKFFHRGYEMRGGVLTPILPPAEELPTFRQFRYWYEKCLDIRQTISSRKGARKFLLQHRALIGDSSQMAFGPGSLWQIDATVGDLYLVSSIDRSRIIGRPVIYLVVDVFSRLIVGFYVGLEGPSWLGMIMALENATADKVEFCKTHGIDITEEQWPCCYQLCEALLGDRGELLSNHADNLAAALGIRVDNTPPYRPDWKPIVERYFRLSNDKAIHWIPGAVHHQRERGEKDYRLDACMDLNQFRKLMCLVTLDHNTQHRLYDYPMDEFMIREHIEPYPIDLWHWGVQNRVGRLRTVTPEIIRLNLLPSTEASVTERGIYHQGLYYTCELATREQWFIKARTNGRWKISIAYDPRNLTNIYIRLDGGKRMEVCSLSPRSKTYNGRNWYEVTDYFALKDQADQSAKTRSYQAKADFHSQFNKLVDESIEATEKELTSLSKNARTKEIRQNRKEERERQREIEAWQLGVDQTADELASIVEATSLDQDKETEEKYIPPHRPIEKLRKKRDRN